MVYGLMNAPTIDSSMINPATIDKNTRTITFTIGTPTTAYTISNPDISKIKLNGSAITSATISGNTVTIKYNSNLLNGNNTISFEAGTFNAIGDEVIYTGTTPNDAFNVSVNVSLNSVPTPAVNTSAYSNDTFTATFNLKDLIGGTATTFDASKISIENNAAAIDGTPILNGNTLTVKLKSKDSNRLNGIYKIIVAQGAIKNTGDNINYINETKQNESFSLDCNHTLSILPTANLTVKNIKNNIMTVGITFGQDEMLINNYAALNTHQDKISITGLTSSQFTVSPVSSYEFTITVDPNVTAGDYPVTISIGAVTVDELGVAGRKYDRAQTSSNAVSNPGIITIVGSSSGTPDEFGYIEGVDYEYRVDYRQPSSKGIILTFPQIADDYAAAVATDEDEFWDFVEACGYELWFKGGDEHNNTTCLVVCREASNPVDQNGDPYEQTINSSNPQLINENTYWTFRGSDPTNGEIELVGAAYGNMNFVLYKK